MRSLPINAKSGAPVSGDEIDLLEIFGTLRRGKWRILFWMALMAVLAIYYAYRMVTPLYTTTATVALLNRSEKIIDLASPLSGLSGDNNYTVNTEVANLTSRGLLIKVVDKLNLVEDPVFNEALRPIEGGIDRLPSVAIGWVVSLLRKDRPPELPLSAEEERNAVTDAVMDSLSVKTKPSSYVFYLTVTSEDAAASARVANGLAEAYIEDQVAMKYDATERATIWLSTRVSELRLELEAAENAVKVYSAQTDLVDPEALQALNRQLKGRRDRVMLNKAEVKASEALVVALEAAKATGDPKQMAVAAEDTALNQMVERLEVEGARQAFNTRFARVLARARVDVRQLAAKLNALGLSVSELEMQVERQSAELLKLQQLEREAAASRQIYEHFLGRLKETSVQQGIHRAESRILARALPPEASSKPRKGLIVAMALFLGFLIGAGQVLLRETRQNVFRSAEDLEQATGIVVLGQIPQARRSKRRRLLSFIETKPTSALAESIRNLRTSVLLSNIDNSPQIIMLTSSLSGEGKTTQSLALAHSFVGLGKRVLLIEGDIRRRTFQEYFRVSRHQAGLIEAVTGEVPLEEAVIFDEKLGADVLLGKKFGANAVDFFSSNRFSAFLERIRPEYDQIVIDTPPVLAVSDARVIGQFADAIIYVVRWNRTTRVQVEAGISSLASVGLKIAGVSLSQINVREAKGYGGKYNEIYGTDGGKYYIN